MRWWPCSPASVITTPQAPAQHQGGDLAARFLATVIFRRGCTCRLVAARANGQPAFGVYLPDPSTGVTQRQRPARLLTLAGNQITAVTRFHNSALACFGAPPDPASPSTPGRGTGPLAPHAGRWRK